MSKKTAFACLAVIGALLLSGCLKEDANYTLREDNMVDGVLVLALHNDYAGDPPTDTVHDIPTISSKYSHTTITDLGQPNWTGSRVTFTDEPIGTFSTATENWDIAVSRSGSQYVVSGTSLDPAEESNKQTIRDNGGSSVLKVTFPGSVSEHNGSLSGRTVTWDLLTATEAPYARGSAVPDAPPPDPEPEPVVTVVITPDPVVTASVTPSAAPSATPSEVPNSEGSNSIPGWVWAIGGVLVAALAGMIGYALANRKTPSPAEPVVTPKAKSKAKVVEEPVETEPEDEEPEDEEPEDEAPKKKPSPKK